MKRKLIFYDFLHYYFINKQKTLGLIIYDTNLLIIVKKIVIF